MMTTTTANSAGSIPASGISRRAFLSAAAMTAGLALPACGGESTPEAESDANASVDTVVPVVNDAPAQDVAWEPPVLIACAGDSITWGFGVEETRDADSYPAQLQMLLAEAGASTQVENYGLCGACALSSGKNPYTDFAEYWDSLASGADLVILMLGTNDAASIYWDQATYETELTERIEAYQQQEAATGTAPQVILMIPPNILSTEWAGGVPANKVDEMQQGARNVADRLSLTSVDLEPIFGEDAELFSDGVHPNAAGNALIAQAVFELLS